MPTRCIWTPSVVTRKRRMAQSGSIGPICCVTRSAMSRAWPRKETLANLTALPDAALEAVRKVLRGETLVSADEAFEVERSVPHGNVAAAHVMASRLGMRALLGPPCRERDIAYALILSRGSGRNPSVHRALVGGGGSTLGADLGVADASTDEVYQAMDWLASRQREIEKKLATRHLPPAGPRCSTCRPPGWRAAIASWPPSAIPATASAAAGRSSTGC